jgi:hypothetical protein
MHQPQWSQTNALGLFQYWGLEKTQNRQKLGGYDLVFFVLKARGGNHDDVYDPPESQPACRQKHEDTRSNFAHVKPVNPDGPEKDS